MSTLATGPRTDEVDLRELVLALWHKRWVIGASAFICLVLAIAHTLIIATPEFESSALLIPTQTSPQVDQLGAAAVLLGKTGTGQGDVDLYQSLLTSRKVIQRLLKVQIKNQSDTGRGQIQHLYSILEIDTNSPIKYENAVKGLAKSVRVGSKESGDGGILEITVTANSAWLAQEIGNNLLAIGQEELRAIRIERSDVILSRLGIVVSLAKSEWDTAAKKLTWYKDRNRSVILPDQLLEMSRLEIEKTAKEQKYLLVRNQYEMQLLERAKATPPMMILDSANLPARKTRPKGRFVAILGVCIGTIGSMAFVSLKAFVSLSGIKDFS